MFEYLPNGDLETLINKLRGTAKKSTFRGIGQDLTKILMSQLVNAIELLQDNEIMHRDLKPMNVMLDENNTVKLIDFGDAKKMNEAIENDDDFYEALEESLPNTAGNSIVGLEEDDSLAKDGNDSFEFDQEVIV